MNSSLFSTNINALNKPLQSFVLARRQMSAGILIINVL